MLRALIVQFGILISLTLLVVAWGSSQLGAEAKDPTPMQSAVHTEWSPGYNSYFVQMTLAEEVPGFGGYFPNDETGTLNVWFIEPEADWDPLLASIERNFSDQPFLSRDLATRITPLQGRYNYADLERWKSLVTGTKLEFPELVYTDAQELTNRLEIGVTTEDVQPKMTAVLEELGVPRDAITYVVTEFPEVDACTSGTCLDELVNPKIAGLIVGKSNGGTCTLGIYAERYGVPGFITDAHCTPQIGTDDNTVFYQPDTSQPSNQIGVEGYDPPLQSGLNYGWCQPALTFCRFSDSVWAPYDWWVTQYLGVSAGYIARPSSGTSWNGVNTFKITNYVGSNLCDYVTKVGFKTGRTAGWVTNLNMDLYHSGSLIHFPFQTRASYGRDGGDSGGPVFTIASGNNVTIKGMHRSGGSGNYTACNRTMTSYADYSEFNWILNDLDISDFLAP